MSKNDSMSKKAAPADGEKVWKASETFTVENVRLCGATSLYVSAGYLLTLCKRDPKCSRRDERRAIVPINNDVHGAIWNVAKTYTYALPPDTDEAAWRDVVLKMVEAGTTKAAERAAAARKARANKKAAPAAETPAAETPAAETPAAETPAAETPAALDPVVEATAALIGAITGLPPEERAAAARKACQAIMAKFE